MVEYITIPKGGRPPKKFSEMELATLRFERLTMSIGEMAAFHGVSLATMNRWLKKAGCVNERTKEEA